MIYPTNMTHDISSDIHKCYKHEWPLLIYTDTEITSASIRVSSSCFFNICSSNARRRASYGRIDDRMARIIILIKLFIISAVRFYVVLIVSMIRVRIVITTQGWWPFLGQRLLLVLKSVSVSVSVIVSVQWGVSATFLGKRAFFFGLLTS